MEKFKGIFPALLTPFDGQDNVAKGQLEKLVRHDLSLGAKGFYVCGSTGEAFLLSTRERMEVMEVVREAAPEATLIAHIGSVNEKEAELLARHASKLGYDAVSSVAPYYYRFSFPEIRDYYCRLADAAEKPMLVYHIPVFSGVNMGGGELEQFLGDHRFMGLKYTANDLFLLEQCKTAFPHKIFYNGYDEMFLGGLSMGADGGIGSTYNFMADKFVAIQRLFAEGHMAQAQQIQREANRIIAILCRVGVMQAEKEVLTQLGLDMGVCRRPFRQLTQEEKQLLAREVVPFVEVAG